MISKKHQTLALIREWHHALNNGNTDKLATLAWEDVTISGPRGSAKGVRILLEWVERAGITLTPKRYFQGNEIVLAEELGEWHAPQTREITGSRIVATLFKVREGRIESINRYENLTDAFAASGLNVSDEVYA